MNSNNPSEHSYIFLNTSNELFEADVFDVNLAEAENLFSKPMHRSQPKRINAYDTQLIEESSNIATPENFKPKFKIDELKQELGKIDKQIEFAKMTDNQLLVKDLYIERYKITHQINAINDSYGDDVSKDLIKMLIRMFSKIAGKFLGCTKKFKSSFRELFLSKAVRPLTKSAHLKDAIDTLDTLNHNVDELSHQRIPYGENEMRYDALTKCLTQATSIQSLISKEVDKKRK